MTMIQESTVSDVEPAEVVRADGRVVFQRRPRWAGGEPRYYACRYETYRKLKWLHKLYFVALRRDAAWRRWARKLPQNRVRTRYDSAARQRVVIGPLAEPWRLELFGAGRETLRSNCSDPGIVAAYRIARMPYPSADAVPALGLEPSVLDRLWSEASGPIETLGR